MPDEKGKSSEVQRTNKDTFKNKRAQYYWSLRDRFYNTYRAVEKGEYVDPDLMISLSSEIPFLEKLRSEVCRIPKKPNGNGLIQILNKDEMKRLKIPSPNMADSLMMSMRAAGQSKAWKPLNYQKVSIA
jgi:phage terminase large subunit